MLHPASVVFLLMLASVFGENCIKYNFDSGYEDLFRNDTPDCAGIEAWQLGKYTEIGVTGAPLGSDNFIEPTSLSCESSFSFHMGGGVLEVNIYMKSKSDKDQVTVFVNELLDTGGVVLHGTASVQPTWPSYTDGWNVIRISLPQSFTGYVTFLGVKNEDSIVLIDSFRFYKSSHENECQLYEVNATPSNVEEIESTTEITIDPESETTNSPEYLEECVTYNFDHDFDTLFTDQHHLCTGFNTWTLGDYSDIDIDIANARGNSFLKPHEDLSCIAAFPIRMSPNGTVEVNVYIEPVTKLDHIIVLVKHVVVDGTDTVAGFNIYEPSVSAFARGWNVLRVPVTTLRSFDGYLLFLGIASEGSTVLVDSFRYIPPSMSEDDESCAF